MQHLPGVRNPAESGTPALEERPGANVEEAVRRRQDARGHAGDDRRPAGTEQPVEGQRVIPPEHEARAQLDREAGLMLHDAELRRRRRELAVGRARELRQAACRPSEVVGPNEQIDGGAVPMRGIGVRGLRERRAIEHDVGKVVGVQGPEDLVDDAADGLGAQRRPQVGGSEDGEEGLVDIEVIPRHRREEQWQ